MKKLAPLLLAIFLVTPAAAPAQELPRRAQLGVAMAPDRQTGNGATVTQVFPGGTAAMMGIQEGDTIVRAGGQPVTNPDQLVAFAGTLREGMQVELEVRRGERALNLSGAAAGRPLESHQGGRVDYGAVPWRGGRLRDILLTPEGVANPPVVFLIQGFSCATVEPPQPGHPYRRLGEELLRAGIGYYRVEKPGMGDSIGPPNCTEIDYQTELDAFRTAYRHLVESRGIEPDRIFFFGHSLGGMQAPMLAAETAPRGVAAYGTVLRNWADYHRDISMFQGFLITGEDPVAGVERAERARDAIRLFYIDKQAPAAIAAARPELADSLRYDLNWDGGENVFGRHYSFAQQLSGLPLVAAWRDSRTNVLAVYGASDLVAYSDEDHRLIPELVNFYRPGTARYVEVPNTAHGMDLVGDRHQLREATRAAGQMPEGEFNPEVARILAQWVQESMARPPVRTQSAARG